MEGYTRNFNLGEFPEEIEVRGGSKMPNQGAGGKVMARFFTREYLNEEESARKGRPCHGSFEMVQFIIPGDRGSMPERRVNDNDKIEYARSYEAFKRQEEIAPSGTLLESWPILTRAMVLDLKSQNIYTVEQVAELSDANLSAIGMGARQLRAHAVAYIETAKTGAVPAALIAENEQLKNSVKLLTHQMGELARKFESMAQKAGEKMEDVNNPILEARISAGHAVQKDYSVAIPQDYHKLGFAKLREICGQIGNMPVLNKDQAIELIAEYIGTQKSFAA